MSKDIPEESILFQAHDFGHEEGWYFCIYEKDGKLFRHTDGHNVYNGDFDVDEEVTQEEALAEMLEEADKESEW